MRILEPGEGDKMDKALHNRGSRVRNYLNEMQVGQELLVPAEEWKWKSAPPSYICRRVEEKSTKKFNCYKLLDGSGWVIKRME